MANYVDNMYSWLKKKGYASKYEQAGIYCIKIDSQIVYIGKSHNMLKRIAEHYVGVKMKSEQKYRIMALLQQQGHVLEFDVLYYANGSSRKNIDEEIGEKEGEMIRQFQPLLNTQIPKEGNWRKWDTKKLDEEYIFQQLL